MENRFTTQKPVMVKDLDLLKYLMFDKGKAYKLYRIKEDKFDTSKRVFFFDYEDEIRDIVSDYLLTHDYNAYVRFINLYFGDDVTVTLKEKRLI